MTKFKPSQTADTIWVKARDLAETETMFLITGASKGQQPAYGDASRTEGVLIFELILEDGREAKCRLSINQERLKVYEQVKKLRKNDVLEDLYFVMKPFEKEPAKVSKGKVVKAAVLGEYPDFSDVPQSVYDAQKEAEVEQEGATE